MNTSDTTARIAASIDWQPTCLPGDEQRTIVRQVLDAAAILAASAAPETGPSAADLDVARRMWSAHEALEKALFLTDSHPADVVGARRLIRKASEATALEAEISGGPRAAPETSDPDAANLLELAEKWGAESLRRRAAAEFEAQHDQQEMVGESHALGDCAQELRAALAAAATPAPPVDAAARLRAAAKAGNHVRCQTTSDPFAYVQLIDSTDMLGHFLATNPDDPVAQAITRALTATPTEETRTDG